MTSRFAANVSFGSTAAVAPLEPVGRTGRPTAAMAQPRKPVDSQGIAATTASASKSDAM